MQRATRSDYNLKERLFKNEKTGSSKTTGSKTKSYRPFKTNPSKIAAGIGQGYPYQIRQSVEDARKSVSGGYSHVAEELNRRGISNALGESWNFAQVKCLLEFYDSKKSHGNYTKKKKKNKT